MRCAYCNTGITRWTRTNRTIPSNAATKQHIIPVRRGGSNHHENLRRCCLACNQALALFDDCPGALAAAAALGEAMGFGKGAQAARGALRRQNMVSSPDKPLRVTFRDVWPAA